METWADEMNNLQVETNKIETGHEDEIFVGFRILRHSPYDMVVLILNEKLHEQLNRKIVLLPSPNKRKPEDVASDAPDWMPSANQLKALTAKAIEIMTNPAKVMMILEWRGIISHGFEITYDDGTKFTVDSLKHESVWKEIADLFSLRDQANYDTRGTRAELDMVQKIVEDYSTKLMGEINAKCEEIENAKT